MRRSLRQAAPLFALFAALLCAACSDPVDVFYSTDYPVLRIEAEVTLDGVGSGGSGEEAGDGSGETGTPGDTGAEPVAGSFTKIPASSELAFAYGDHTYSAHLSHYTEDGGPSRVRFAVDLTDLYRERYGIESGLRVVRYEYTDHLTD